MSALRKGQCLKPLETVDAAREWGVEPDAVGAVLCSYKVLLDDTHRGHRVDVRFGDGQVIWGAPVCAFALVNDPDDRKY